MSIGKVITFYSYKGGVGRSMALANIGTMLSKWGKKVLIIDFDLEAPGIENYFKEFKKRQNPNSGCKGVVDLIINSKSENQKNWQDAILKFSNTKHKINIDILPSGSSAVSYAENIQNLDWEGLFSKNNLGLYLEQLRNEWKAEYDFILIDSRTGLSDIGGICTIYLPDVIAFLFTTNEASIDGCIDIIERVKKSRDLLPFDRSFLITLPLPSRDESRTENQLALEWHQKFTKKLEKYYKDWLPREVSASVVIDLIRIPYIPIWSFGDRLPVIEEGVTKIDSIGYIYDKAAKLLINDFDWTKVNQSVINEKIDDKQNNNNMNVENYIQDRVDGQIHWFSHSSQKNKRAFYALTTTQIVSAATLPVIANINVDTFLVFKDLLTGSIGILIVVISGLLSISKYRENWLKYRRNAELLKQEKYKFLTGSFPYDENESFSELVDRVEKILSKENEVWENTMSQINTK